MRLLMISSVVFSACAQDRTPDTSFLGDSISQVAAPRVDTPTFVVDTAEISYTDSTGRAEAQRIALAGEAVRREKGVLFLQVRNGSVIELRDELIGDAFQRNVFAKVVDELDAFLVEEYYYEGFGFLLISRSTGQQVGLGGAPLPSPKRDRFVATSMDLDAGFISTGIEVYNTTGDSIALEWSWVADDCCIAPWGPSDAVWVNDTTIHFVKNVAGRSPTPHYPYARSPMILRRSGNSWKMEPGT